LVPSWRDREATVRVQLTPRALVLLLVTMLPLAAASIDLVFVGVAVGWLVLLLAVLLTDLRLTPAAAAWELRREHDKRLSLAADNRIAVIVRLRAGPRRLAVWLRDEPPPTFGIAEADRVLTATVRPGEPLTLVYTVRPPRRGDYTFGDLHLRWRSALGLIAAGALSGERAGQGLPQSGRCAQVRSPAAPESSLGAGVAQCPPFRQRQRVRAAPRLLAG
jgi:uncharacterized protein (DUF58 family)